MALVFGNVVRQAGYNELVVACRLAISLRMICCARKMFRPEERTYRLEKLAFKLWPIVCKNKSGNPLQQDTMFEKDRRKMWHSGFRRRDRPR